MFKMVKMSKNKFWAELRGLVDTAMNICGLEINLAGSAKFLPPNLKQKKKYTKHQNYLPQNSTCTLTAAFLNRTRPEIGTSLLQWGTVV